MTSKTSTIAAAMYGCWAAIQVRPIAPTSSPKLSAMFEIGSGEGVTAARRAVLPPCAAKAIAAPSTAEASCIPGDKMRSCDIRDERRNWNANKRLQRVPDEVERRNLVGEELKYEHRQANADDPPGSNGIQRGGKCDQPAFATSDPGLRRSRRHSDRRQNSCRRASPRSAPD